MNGRMYRLFSPAASGTQRWSASTSASTACTKSAGGSSGSASRWLERTIRSALASGRKVQTDPSSCR